MRHAARGVATRRQRAFPGPKNTASSRHRAKTAGNEIDYSKFASSSVSCPRIFRVDDAAEQPEGVLPGPLVGTLAFGGESAGVSQQERSLSQQGRGSAGT